MTERRLDHLDPATIAALVDRTLEPPARAAAEAHLAACADCREVWVETSEMVGAGEETAADTPLASPIVVPHRPRARRWLYAGAGLAAAAAIGLAVVSPRLFDRGDRPELRELVDAVGENRRTEGRLTGGFKWGPVPSARRGDSADVSTAVQAAAARLRANLDAADARAMAAAGAAETIVGNPSRAVRDLERAVALDEGVASYWADLAAAHLEAARLQGNTQSGEAALRATEHALQLAPTMLEALFNRALALEYLGRARDAQAAWSQYLSADPSSEWADEARRRMAAGTR